MPCSFSMVHTSNLCNHDRTTWFLLIQSNQLSIEKILLDTIHAWSNVRLTELQQRIQELNIATDCKYISLLTVSINATDCEYTVSCYERSSK